VQFIRLFHKGLTVNQPQNRTHADGLGDSGEGWSSIGDEFAPELPHCRFVFPHAPLVR